MKIFVGATVMALFLFLIVWLAMGRRSASQAFVCPDCGRKFFPQRRNLLFALHMAEAHALVCPYCHKKNFCPPARDVSAKSERDHPSV